MRILWLDDEPRRVAPFSDALAESGHDVNLVSDIKTFETAVATEHWDIALLDVMMPPDGYVGTKESQYGLDTGLVLARKLRDRFPELRIMLFTDRLDLSSAGDRLCVEVLRKSEVSPWGLEELLQEKAR